MNILAIIPAIALLLLISKPTYARINAKEQVHKTMETVVQVTEDTADAVTTEVTETPTVTSSPVAPRSRNTQMNNPGTGNANGNTQVIQDKAQERLMDGTGEPSTQLIKRIRQHVKEMKPEEVRARVQQLTQLHQEEKSKLQEQYKKLEERSGIVKFLLGADKETLDELEQLKAENEERLAELKALAETAVETGDKEELLNTIEEIRQENQELSQKIQEEAHTGIFGRILSIFKR